MNSVDMTASKAIENAVQRITRMKISQTWLASQTGPIAESISRRARAALAVTADERPKPGAEVRAAEDGVERGADPEDRRGDVGPAHPGPPTTGGGGSSRGPYGTSTASEPASRQRRASRRSTSTVATPSTV